MVAPSTCCPEDKSHLHFEIVRTDSLNVASVAPAATWFREVPDLPLYRDDGLANDTMVVVHAAISGKTVEHRRRLCRQGFDFPGTRKFDERTGYRSQSFLTVPMRNHEGEIIGVLQLINARMPEHDVVVPFPGGSAPRRVARLAGRHRADQPATVAPALKSCSNLSIRLINSAIDDKSPLYRRALPARSRTDDDVGRGRARNQRRAARRFPPHRPRPL